MSTKDALNEISNRVGIDLDAYKKSFEVHCDGNSQINYNTKPKIVKIDRTIVANKEIAYEKLEPSKGVKEYNFYELINSYNDLTEKDKFCVVVSSIYHYSLKTNQNAKNNYYVGRNISGKYEPMLKSKIIKIVKQIGYLSMSNDVPNLISYLTSKFPLADLVKFGILNDANHKVPYSFKHFSEEGFIVIPNFDLYSNLILGLKLRNTKLAEWQNSSMKEPELSYGRIASPYPYGLNIDALKENYDFRFFEGQIDMFSIPEKDNVCDLAIPGVYGLKQEQLGLFKGKKIELWYDQDDAGQKVANGSLIIRIEQSFDLTSLKDKGFIEELKRTKYSINFEFNENIIKVKDIEFPKNRNGLEKFRMIEVITKRRNIPYQTRQIKGLKDKLIEAGVLEVTVKQWDTKLGSDVNDVLKRGNIRYLI